MNKRAWLREGMSVLALIVATLTARSSVAEHYQVPTGSMIPTIEVGDRVLVNKLAYGVVLPFSETRLLERSGPRRGDVAVLRSPVDDTTLIKRVVAVPGDTVRVRQGRLWIGGRAVPMIGDAPGALEVLGHSIHGVRLDGRGGPDFGPVTLREDEYLVMGDNRGNSHDGRTFGLVSHRSFLGRASGIFWSGGRPTWQRL